MAEAETLSIPPALEEKREEICQALEEELRLQRAQRNESLRAEAKEQKELGLDGGVNDVEERIAREEAEETGSDLARKVWRVTNNFYFWWSGGWNRILDKSEEAVALARDVDEIISTSGYGHFEKLILSPDGLEPEMKEARALILADVYLQMREKGYDRKLLTK